MWLAVADQSVQLADVRLSVAVEGLNAPSVQIEGEPLSAIGLDSRQQPAVENLSRESHTLWMPMVVEPEQHCKLQPNLVVSPMPADLLAAFEETPAGTTQLPPPDGHATANSKGRVVS